MKFHLRTISISVAFWAMFMLGSTPVSATTLYDAGAGYSTSSECSGSGPCYGGNTSQYGFSGTGMAKYARAYVTCTTTGTVTGGAFGDGSNTWSLVSGQTCTSGTVCAVKFEASSAIDLSSVGTYLGLTSSVSNGASCKNHLVASDVIPGQARVLTTNDPSKDTAIAFATSSGFDDEFPASPEPTTAYAYRPANGSQIRYNIINKTGSCPPGDPPQDGSCAWYWFGKTTVPVADTYTEAESHYEVRATNDDLLCEGTQGLDASDGTYKGIQFWPQIDGCGTFEVGAKYKWRWQFKLHTADDYGAFSNYSVFQVVANDKATGAGCTNGYCEAPVVGTPSCDFWGTDSGDGLGCVFSWLVYSVDPTAPDWSVFGTNLDPFTAIWPFSYAAQINTQLTEAYAQTPTCPIGTISVDFGAVDFGDFDVCDGVAEKITPLTESDEWSDGYKALGASILITTVVGIGYAILR